MCLRLTFLSLLGEIRVLGGENKLRVHRACVVTFRRFALGPATSKSEVLKARFELFGVRPVRGVVCDYSDADRLPF